MGRLRHRLFGWGCLAIVAINVAAVICGGIPGASTRMPCCVTLGDGQSMPTLAPCCAAEQRQQADPASTATNSAAAQPAADASTLLGRLIAPQTAALLNHSPRREPFGSPPAPYLLLAVLLI
jgi:hypothetical protein